MKLLLDTHVLLWAAAGSALLPRRIRGLLEAPDTEPVFSVASLWEIVIKRSLGRTDFRADPRLLRRGLLDNGYVELPVLGPHALAVDQLEPIHKDPFDRLLVAQARIEGLPLLTADDRLLAYGSPVERI